MGLKTKETLSFYLNSFPSKWVKGVNEDISRFHRIQISKGYSDALSHIEYILKSEGIEYRILKYPFQKEKSYFYLKFFPYWEIKKGYLKIIHPFTETIADFKETPLSVIPRSKKVRGIYTIIDIENFKSNNGKKILLTDNFRKGVYKTYRKNAGILYYGMPKIENVREEGELENAIHYVSFWEEGFFGFSISPAKGRKLKNLLKKHKKLKAEVVIDSEFKEGEIEVLEIYFKGKSKREIWLLAHLCHPAPFANDNASGTAVALGIAKLLKELMKKEKRFFKNSLRILLIPEMTGTIAYLYKNRDNLKNVITSLNLDMVGEDQEKCKSVMQIEREPFFLRSFNSYLLNYIAELLPEKTKNFHGSSEIPLFRKTVSNYSGGSDHYILISPDFGIPSSMINYWPDKYYHTTADTVDKVSEISLSNTGAISLTFIHFLLDLGKEDVEFLKNKMLDIHKRNLLNLKIKEEKNEKIMSEIMGFENALKSLRRIYNDIDVKDEIKKSKEFVKKEKLELNFEDIEIKENYRLKKLFKGVPVSLMKHFGIKEREKIGKKTEKIKNYSLLVDLISYLANRKPIKEILRYIKLEIGEINLKDIETVISILEKGKFLERI